jgi:hypothetical protein
MDLTVEPELYAPSLDDAGTYVDKVHYAKYGLVCPCGARRDKVYESTTKFQQHIKTKVHQKWLEDLNANKSNFYIRVIELEETVKQQRILLAQQERVIQTKSKTIDILTERLTPKPTPMGNLLHLDE